MIPRRPACGKGVYSKKRTDLYEGDVGEGAQRLGILFSHTKSAPPVFSKKKSVFSRYGGTLKFAEAFSNTSGEGGEQIGKQRTRKRKIVTSISGGGRLMTKGCVQHHPPKVHPPHQKTQKDE